MVRSSIRYGQSRDSQSTDLSVLYPRFWKVLVVLAVPFIIMSSNYFEALERTGIIGAYIADLLQPVTIIGYFILIFMLRKREI
jgi:drug/metabolite transporter (DMT)-like permease